MIPMALLFSGADATYNLRDRMIISNLRMKIETGMVMTASAYSPVQLVKARWPEVVTGRTAKKAMSQLVAAGIPEEVEATYLRLVRKGDITG
jgi:hypothetical protein